MCGFMSTLFCLFCYWFLLLFNVLFGEKSQRRGQGLEGIEGKNSFNPCLGKIVGGRE